MAVNDKISLEEVSLPLRTPIRSPNGREEFVQRPKIARAERLLKENSTVRKVGVNASADIRTTIKQLSESTDTLPDRAGYCIMSFGARADHGNAAAPFDMVPKELEGFCEKVLGVPKQLVSMKMEAYLLNGGAAAIERRMVKTKDIRAEVQERLRLSFGTYLHISFISSAEHLSYRNYCFTWSKNQLLKLAVKNRYSEYGNHSGMAIRR